MPLLEVKELKKFYPVKTALFKKEFVKAVDNVSFNLNEAEIVGLVGESGCGKSTLGRSIIRLEEPTDGEIFINNLKISNLSKRELRKKRTDFQMIFQDPYGSLNPRLTIEHTIGEVVKAHSKLNKKERHTRIIELLKMVGLSEEHLRRYPHQFSGGQRQRIGIARALAVNPKLIVADEPVSALDVSVQAQIVNLMEKIRSEYGISFLFIAHDLAVVEHVCSTVMVMYLGKIVEQGVAKEVVKNPQHPYTKALLSAVPNINRKKLHDKKRIILEGDVPSPLNPPSGCSFHPRCALATEKCTCEEPILSNLNNSGHYSACFYSKGYK
ncbi:dipeptide ABC transporter ATP-binding protein [Lentisphaerota bacterium WC36G]|nr:dipeptide ABC transporter ATP-binding protein [Lentisphaerae bacterium WC36]